MRPPSSLCRGRSKKNVLLVLLLVLNIISWSPWSPFSPWTLSLSPGVDPPNRHHEPPARGPVRPSWRTKVSGLGSNMSQLTLVTRTKARIAAKKAALPLLLLEAGMDSQQVLREKVGGLHGRLAKLARAARAEPQSTSSAARVPVPNKGACDHGEIEKATSGAASAAVCSKYYDGRHILLHADSHACDYACVFVPGQRACFPKYWAKRQEAKGVKGWEWSTTEEVPKEIIKVPIESLINEHASCFRDHSYAFAAVPASPLIVRDGFDDVAVTTITIADTASSSSRPPPPTLWRLDEKCGGTHTVSATAANGRRVLVTAGCNPHRKPCCSAWGFCGSTARHCNRPKFDYRCPGAFRGQLAKLNKGRAAGEPRVSSTVFGGRQPPTPSPRCPLFKDNEVISTAQTIAGSANNITTTQLSPPLWYYISLPSHREKGKQLVRDLKRAGVHRGDITRVDAVTPAHVQSAWVLPDAGDTPMLIKAVTLAHLRAIKTAYDHNRAVKQHNALVARGVVGSGYNGIQP